MINVKRERYKNQILFDKIGDDGQDILLNSKICIIGTGALGSTIANSLCRSGIGNLLMVDRGIADRSNLQRSPVLTEEDAENLEEKVLSLKKYFDKYNSKINIEAIFDDVDSTNIEKYISDVDIVIDATDNYETHFLINEACHKNNQNWIFGEVSGSFGRAMNFIQGQSPCFHCLVKEAPAPGTVDICNFTGATTAVTQIIAAFISNEAIKILLKADDEIAKDCFVVDIWQNLFTFEKAEHNANCPVCSQKRYKYLNTPANISTKSMCGHNSTQFVPKVDGNIDLQEIAKKLEKIGNVELTSFCLTFKNLYTHFKLFPDGKATIIRTIDKGKAKRIYSEYIGL